MWSAFLRLRWRKSVGRWIAGLGTFVARDALTASTLDGYLGY